MSDTSDDMEIGAALYDTHLEKNNNRRKKMASKFKRVGVGSVLKSKTKGEPDYIVLKGMAFDALKNAMAKADKEKGLSLKLESKQFKLDTIAKLIDDGKIDEEYGEKLLDNAEKMPDFVRFEIVLLNKED